MKSVQKTCRICFTNFNHGRSDRTMCSKKCYDLHKNNKRRHLRKDPSIRLDGTQTKPCKYCNKLVTVKTPNKLACSKQCLHNLNKVKQYNLSVDEHLTLTSKKRCDLCQTKDTHQLCIDHDHKTGKVRGYLCSKCNIGLGHFNDNPEILKRAFEYLKRLEC